ILDDSWLSPTPYYNDDQHRAGDGAGPQRAGFGGPRSRQGAHNVENIARRLVPLTSASCKEDGSDCREMSGDVRLLSAACASTGRDIHSLDPRELRRHATLVLQTPVLFATPCSPSTSR